MKQNEKLKLVFDFIADYLTDETSEIEETTETTEEKVIISEGEDNMKRAYTIMKKIEERDKQDAVVKKAVKVAVDPLKAALKEAKDAVTSAVRKEKTEQEEEFLKKTGVTLDDNGQIVTVEVETLSDDRTNEDVLKEVGVINSSEE